MFQIEFKTEDATLEKYGKRSRFVDLCEPQGSLASVDQDSEVKSSTRYQVKYRRAEKTVVLKVTDDVKVRIAEESQRFQIVAHFGNSNCCNLLK